MKAIKLLMVVIAVSLWGCSDNCDLQLAEDSESKDNSTFVSEQEALENADKFFEQIGKNVRGDKRTVESIKVLGVNPTRSESGFEGLLYLINYSDNEGFALMGTDTRMYDIYAISDQGHLDYEDRDHMPMLDFFFHNSLVHAYKSINENAETRGISWGTGNGSTTSISHKLDPIIPLNSSRWGQLEPFNDYTDTEDGQISYPGCVPVAMAIYMSYYKWPNNYNMKNYNWDAMVDDNNLDEVAQFLSNLGQPSLLNCKYTTDGGYVNDYRILFAFQNLNYTLNYDHIGINVLDNLDQFIGLLRFGSAGTSMPQPIMVIGKNKNGNNSKHCFIVDGEITKRVNKFQNGVLVLTYEVAPLLHIVWGWEGRLNGYYQYDTLINSVSDDIIEPDNDWDWFAKLPETHRFRDFVYYGGFLPKK